MAETIEIKPPFEIPAHLIGQVQSKLAYVDEAIAGARIAEGGAAIHVELRAKLAAAKQKALEAKVVKVVEEMAKGAVQPKVEVLEDHLDRPTAFAEDPMPELLARGEVSEEYTGIFSFGPLMTRLMEVFEGEFLALAAEFGAKPHRFPTLISAEKLGRVQYFRAFPHSLTFATHLREDLDIINEFSQHAAYEEPDGLNAGPESFSRIQALLSPAVCYHLYFSLADKPLPGGQMAVTAVGNCFRYESNNLTSLERMWNFTMREVIFVGPADFVLENRERGRQYMEKTFERFGLAYMVESANDPFFVGEFRRQAAFQNAFQLKYEIRARLPFKDSTLAVGSYNYHQDFFGRNLNITLPDGKPVHTGCVAFGLERIAYAFLSQFGLDPANWPAAVRKAFETA
jgi:seryl-tRNA synthetase